MTCCRDELKGRTRALLRRRTLRHYAYGAMVMANR